MAPALPAWIPYLLLFLLALVVTPALLLIAGRAKRRRAIPRAELAALGTAIRSADALAAEGRVGDGLACLVAGVRRAEQARQQRAPWAQELVDRWQSVVEEYAAEHRIGPASEVAPGQTAEGRGDEASASGRAGA